MNPRHKVFELEQANALVPQLELLLAQWEAKYDAFRRLEDELFFMELVDGHAPPEECLQELEKALLILEEEIQKIRELGCILRHVERGLVDFLGRRDEGWIYYCWQRGEREIQFYHNLRGGFFERRPLPGKESSSI